jgi:hypothetical protein
VRGAHHRLCIVRRSSGSVVTRRRAQMLLLSAQAMDVGQIARVTFASPDRVRDVLHNFNLDGSTPGTRATAAPDRRPSPWPSAERSSSSPCHVPRTTSCRSRPGRWRSWLSSWSPRGGRRHQPRGPTGAAPRAGRVVSTPEDLKQSRDPDFEATWSRSFSATASVSWRPSWCRVLRAVCARPSPRSSWRRRWRRQAELADGSDPECGRPGRPEPPKAWWLLASGAHCPRQHDEPPSRTWSASLSAIEGSALCGPAFPQVARERQRPSYVLLESVVTRCRG